jgi:LPS O-antigen subunit length determinant protein (WzzB/FepE family)
MTMNQDLKDHQATYPYWHLQQEDEISLFDLIDTIWEEKSTLIFFVILSLAVGSIAIFATKTNNINSFEVEYAINYSSISTTNSCKEVNGYDKKHMISLYSKCQNNEVVKDFIKLLKANGLSIQPKSSKFYASISSDVEKLDVMKMINEANSDLAKKYANEAHSELEFLKANFSNSAKINDFIADRLLSSQKIITIYEQHKKLPIDFSKPSINPANQQRTILIACLSIALGFIIGVSVILTRRAFVNHRKSKTTEAHN